MIKTRLQNKLRSVAEKHKWPTEVVLLETPRNPDHGDWATNMSFRLAKTLKKAPPQIAVEVSDLFNADPELSTLGTFEPLNGFINITVKDAWLWELGQECQIQEDAVNHKFSAEKVTLYNISKQKMLLEYVSANPTGPLHIGHGRWAAMGSVMHRVLAYTGHNIDSEFYINDAGIQIKNFRASIAAVKNNDPIPEDGYHGQYVRDIAKQPGDPVELMLENQQQTLSKMGVRFDTWFSELELHGKNAINDALEKLKTKKLAYEKEGALWFKSSEFGDEKDRVLVKSDGSYTYFAVDIAYHFNKINRGYETLINIWGADHHGYVARMKAGVAAVGPEKFASEQQFKIIIGQLVSLFRDGEPVKMSKRSGEMITLEEVIDEIGADATRYFLVEKGADTHIDFDLELAKRQSKDNPVYYIQYAHARMCSIIRNLKEAEPPSEPLSDKLAGLNLQERNLLKQCLMFDDELVEAALNLTPHKITHYAYELARKIQLFYEASPILKSEGAVKSQRVRLLNLAKTTLETTLNQILGISAPEKM